MADLDLKQQNLLTLIGVLLARHPTSFADFMRRESPALAEKPTTYEMVSVLTQSLLQGGDGFSNRLARFLSSLLPNEEATNYTGSDPLSAVAGAVSSISDIFGQAQRNKQFQMQARQQTMDGVLAYRQYQQQLQQQKQQHLDNQNKRNGIIRLSALLGGLSLASLLIWLILKPSSKT